MLQSVKDGIIFIFSAFWRFFTELTFPGTGFTFAQLAIALLVIDFAFTFLGSLLGLNISGPVRDVIKRRKEE